VLRRRLGARLREQEVKAVRARADHAQQGLAALTDEAPADATLETYNALRSVARRRRRTRQRAASARVHGIPHRPQPCLGLQVGQVDADRRGLEQQAA
jgi:hypothetical protein